MKKFMLALGVTALLASCTSHSPTVVVTSSTPSSTSTTSTFPSTTTSTFPSTTTTVVPSGNAIRVQGDQLTQGGRNLQLRGVNLSRTEYACTQIGTFTTGGQTPAQMVNATATWNVNKTPAVNTIRISLNESCWLGINKAKVGAVQYQQNIKEMVDTATSQGQNVVLALHWSAPGSWLPGTANGTTGLENGQNIAPNADHSVALWQQVAEQYKSYGNVLFDLFNEPGISCNAGGSCPANILNGGYAKQDDWAWRTYRDGGTYTYTNQDGDMYRGRAGQSFQVAGTQQLTNVIRATGSVNPIIIETLGFGNGFIDMQGTHMPFDPANQLIASIHSYDFSGYNAGNAQNQQNLDNVFKTGLTVNYENVPNITGRYPMFFGEIGTTGGCPGVNTEFMTNVLNYMNARNYSYTAWGFDAPQNCQGPSLVTNNATGATTPYGAIVKDFLNR